MVKRQTVWLSTMMVLSLMLIGYYTMNNPASPASTTPTNPSSTTQTTNPTSGTQATGADTTSSSSAGTSTSATATSGSDWFTNEQTLVDQALSQQIDSLKAVMANNNSSPDQVATAAKQEGQAESLYTSLQQATQAIIADGYKSAVISPDKSQQTFEVYVETSSLQKDDAIKIMNIVSQQLDVSMLNISVKAHQ